MEIQNTINVPHLPSFFDPIIFYPLLKTAIFFSSFSLSLSLSLSLYLSIYLSLTHSLTLSQIELLMLDSKTCHHFTIYKQMINIE